MKNKFRLLNNIIKENNNFVLLSHVHTDGDALGSLLAFYHYLTDLGKTARVFVPGDVPPKYDYLKTGQFVNKLPVQQAIQQIRQSRVIIVLDISAADRLDVYFDAVQQASAIKVCIDHHPLKKAQADLYLIDTTRIATAEIIYAYLRYSGVDISYAIAEALYTAILSDSGSFRFTGTSAYTLQMAAELAALGVDPSKIYSRVYENANQRQLKAWGKLLSKMQSDDYFCWTAVSQTFLQKNKISLEEIDGLIDIMRKDGEALIFAVFVEKAQHEILVGLRSKNGVDVGEIARSFGGGGHFHAAGFTGRKSLQEVIEETRVKIKQTQEFR